MNESSNQLNQHGDQIKVEDEVCCRLGFVGKEVYKDFCDYRIFSKKQVIDFSSYTPKIGFTKPLKQCLKRTMLYERSKIFAESTQNSDLKGPLFSESHKLELRRCDW